MLAVWPGTREFRWLVANGASHEQAPAQRGAVTRASPPGQFLGWVGELQQREVTAVSWPSDGPVRLGLRSGALSVQLWAVRPVSEPITAVCQTQAQGQRAPHACHL